MAENYKFENAYNASFWIGPTYGVERGYCISCGYEGCATLIWDGCEGYKFCPNCGRRIIFPSEIKGRITCIDVSYKVKEETE